ncbi:uncharacterized protein LOC131670803 isoform X1 [Phymastichus coffea]|uniref:uncharacterized protein LOC131670803 isoform X1 n=1 Tax=Phymastichus coffea TaxID=108790 RepID=UPI00273AFC9E|nr:uncharacterized protein LOC131670803 isoform X1 [Phymastichus coffea]
MSRGYHSHKSKKSARIFCLFKNEFIVIPLQIQNILKVYFINLIYKVLNFAMMNGVKLFKKFLMPCGVCAAIPVLKQSKSKEDVVQVSNENPDKKLVRPSELPIYMFEKPAIRETPCKEHEEKPGVLEQSFGSVRKSLQDILKQFTGYTDKIINTIETGKAHSQVTLDYLREETNVMPRIGAVGLGGLTGLILGLRGGKFKKFVYSYTGAVVVASICYPKQAQEATVLAKYYVNVGYNFLYGVKPGEENQLEINWPELPKVPTNLSEVTDLASSTAGSAVSAVGTLVIKAVNAFNELIKDPEPSFEEDRKKN